MNYLTETEVGNGNTYAVKDQEVNGGGTAKVAVNPSAAEILAFDEGAIWVEVPSANP